MKKIDLSGKIIGRWTVLHESGKNKGNHLLWLCRCDCGKIEVVSGDSLRSGKSKSCGCLAAEQTAMRNYKHGGSDSRLYRIWYGMKMRTENPTRKEYPHYGGRGISICLVWRDFEAFRDWSLANGYSDELSIDRIDVDGNYEPANCRWATSLEQMNNQTSNNFITHNGKTMTLTQWSKEMGIPRATMSSRLHRGKSIEEILKSQEHPGLLIEIEELEVEKI